MRVVRVLPRRLVRVWIIILKVRLLLRWCGRRLRHLLILRRWRMRRLLLKLSLGRTLGRLLLRC
jgi:hypothetical protein